MSDSVLLQTCSCSSLSLDVNRRYQKGKVISTDGSYQFLLSVYPKLKHCQISNAAKKHQGGKFLHFVGTSDVKPTS